MDADDRTPPAIVTAPAEPALNTTPDGGGTATGVDSAGTATTAESATAESATAESAKPPKFRLGNRPPLTGMRAFALSTVLIYHSNFHTWPGSWIAIQIFFVLSGFLITAMLAGEGDRNGRISLKGFYSRRAARLLPPLFLTIALLAIYASLRPRGRRLTTGVG